MIFLWTRFSNSSVTQTAANKFEPDLIIGSSSSVSRKKNTVTLSRFRDEKGDNDEGERILYLMGTKGMTNAMMMMQMISVQIVFVQEKKYSESARSDESNLFVWSTSLCCECFLVCPWKKENETLYFKYGYKNQVALVTYSTS